MNRIRNLEHDSRKGHLSDEKEWSIRYGCAGCRDPPHFLSYMPSSTEEEEIPLGWHWDLQNPEVGGTQAPIISLAHPVPPQKSPLGSNVCCLSEYCSYALCLAAWWGPASLPHSCHFCLGCCSEQLAPLTSAPS